MVIRTRSSCLYCALRGDEPVYWLSTTGSVSDNNGWYSAVVSHYAVVIDVIRSIDGIDAFIH